MKAFTRLVSASLFFLMIGCMQLVCGCTALRDWLEGGNTPIEEGPPPDYWDDGDPKIRPGLLLRIGVTASGSVTVEELQKEVDMNGAIVMPMIGTVSCGGMTLAALQEKIKKAYSTYVIDPQVSVSFIYSGPDMKSPWGSVLVLGSVMRPGPVNMPPTRDLTVTRALMAAGNPTPLADKTRIRVSRREKDGKITRYFIDVIEIGQKGRTELDIQLKPGDVINVPETWY